MFSKLVNNTQEIPPEKTLRGNALCIIGVKIRSKHILYVFELAEIATVVYQCQPMYITSIKPIFYELINAYRD